MYFIFFLFATVLILSCKKEATQEEPRIIEHLFVQEFDSCNCSSLSGKDIDSQYIKATINDVPMCFDVMPATNDTFPNMLKYGTIFRSTGSQYYDNLYMLRNARNSHWQAAIFLENSYALTKTYPYSLPRPNPEVCEIGEFQLNDLDNYVSCAWCPENKYNYYASFFSNGVSMVATSFNNNVFEGTFEGNIITGSGKTAHISNGKFRIRLTVYQEDIDVR